MFCVDALELNHRVMLYTSTDREKNILSDDIFFFTKSETSDLL